MPRLALFAKQRMDPQIVHFDEQSSSILKPLIIGCPIFLFSPKNILFPSSEHFLEALSDLRVLGPVGSLKKRIFVRLGVCFTLILSGSGHRRWFFLFFS